MTLARRLLLAIGAVTVVATLLVGFGVRYASRDAEQHQFEDDFHDMRDRLHQELTRQAGDLKAAVLEICQKDPTVDSALVGLQSGDLGSRRLGLSLNVPALARSHEIDELILITPQGDVLGANQQGLVGMRDKKLADRLGSGDSFAGVRKEPSFALEYGCRKADVGDKRLWVGLYAARSIGALLERVGRSHNVVLQTESVPQNPELLIDTITLDELPGMPLTVTRSRAALFREIESVERDILIIGTVVLAFALLVAYVLARQITRPIVELSRQAREVVHGEPKPVVGRGGKELEQFAEAFNSTLRDLVALRKRLAVSERIAARREVARQVAHEIKNPLAPIRAAVETLRRLRARQDPAFDEYFDEATRTVLDEVNRITNIVTEFTRFARLPAPEPAAMDLVEAVRSVVQLHQGGSVPIGFEKEKLPEVIADRDQIVQVVTNLLNNASDAVRGRAAPRIGVRVGLRGERAVIAVDDNGPGIDPAIRERLFEPYATTKAEGTGLGLAIVQRIVVEHGGSIVCKTGELGGACFEVEIPIAGPAFLTEPPPASREGSRFTPN